MIEITSAIVELRRNWRVRPATMRLLCFFLLLITAKAAVLWWHWSDSVALSIEQTDRATATDRAVVRAFPARADTIAQTKRELIATSNRFIFAPTMAQTITVTASLIADEAAAAGIRLGTIDITTDSILRDGVRMTTVEGDASGEFAGTVAFLRGLDRGRPFFVQRLALSPVSATGTSNQLLHIRFAVVAFARRPFEFER